MWWELSPLTLSRLTGDCTIQYLIIKNLNDDEEEAFEDELAGGKVADGW